MQAFLETLTLNYLAHRAKVRKIYHADLQADLEATAAARIAKIQQIKLEQAFLSSMLCPLHMMMPVPKSLIS